MSTTRVLKLGAQAVPVERHELAAAKRISGNPVQSVQNEYTSADGHFMVGTWGSDVGCWHIAYTEEEYCELLEGHSVITHESGETMHVRKGDRFVIPAGFRGTWEVVEPTRKIYVISEDKAAS